MPKEKNDLETQKIVTESKAVKGLLESEAWPILRTRLVARITNLLDLSNVDQTNPDKIALEVISRRKAADVLWDFLKVDIEGGAEVAQSYDLTLKKESYILRKE